MKQRHKREVQRSVVTVKTVSAVSADTWLLVCSNFYFSPATLLKLMRSSKTIWQALKANPAWWEIFYNRVVQYQSVLYRSNCLSTLEELGKRNKNKQTVIHLVFSTECVVCGMRYGHSIFKPLMKRLCQTCIHDSLVSNKVLLYKYGIHFSDFIIEYCAKGGVPLVHQHPKPSSASFLRITCAPLDLAQRASNHPQNNKAIFFEKRLLKEALGINLEEKARETNMAKEAVQLLLGCFRRMTTHYLMFEVSKHKALGMDALRKHEVQRAINPRRTLAIWLTGGPYYAISTNASVATIQQQLAHSASDAARPSPLIKRRKGMSTSVIASIEKCVDEVAVVVE